MVGYSKVMEANPRQAITLVTALRDQWLEAKTAVLGGEVLKRMGDGWLIAFGSAQDAVDAAVSVQEGLAGHPEIQLRLALHLGELVDDGTDFYGSGINVASRLQAEAPPGAVMISQDLYRQLDPQQSCRFVEAGTFTLKNISLPVPAFVWRPDMVGKPPVGDLPVIEVESIAVYPGSEDLAMAATDLAEELVHRLSRRTGVRVRLMAAESDATAPPTYLLRGSLRPRSDVIRLTLTLLRRADGGVIWSDVYEGRKGEAADLCERAAGQADNDLRLEINAFDGERVAALRDDQLSISELRSRAAQLIYRSNIEDLLHAKALLERAMDLDPDDGMSLAMWAEIAFTLVLVGLDAPDEPTLQKISDSADKAVQALPRSDYVFYVRASVRSRSLRDTAGARSDIARMGRINPSYVLGLEGAALVDLAVGDYRSAVQKLRACIDLTSRDPFQPWRMYVYGFALLRSGQPDEAARAIGEAIELHRDCRTYWLLLADALAASGSATKAAEARRVAAGIPDRPDLQALRITLDGDANSSANRV